MTPSGEPPPATLEEALRIGPPSVPRPTLGCRPCGTHRTSLPPALGNLRLGQNKGVCPQLCPTLCLAKELEKEGRKGGTLRTGGVSGSSEATSPYGNDTELGAGSCHHFPLWAPQMGCQLPLLSITAHVSDLAFSSASQNRT